MNQPTGRATVAHTGLSLDLLLGREPHGDRGAAAEFALELDAGTVVRRGVFHDGKAQAGAAARLGTALVNPVEALEDLLLLLGCDAYARVGNPDVRAWGNRNPA